MLFYTENAKGKTAYMDQDTTAWDRVKGEVTKAVVDARTEKQQALDAAVAVERAKGTTDLKGTPAETKQQELKAVLAAEAHTLVDEEKDIKTPTYRCSWDGYAAHVTTLEGTFPVKGIPIMGWPQTDVAPPLPVATDIPDVVVPE